MNTSRDPVVDALRTLRGLAWQRADHQRRLEKTIMETTSWWQKRSWRAKTAVIGGLVVVGGVAGATTATVIENWIVQVDDVTITGIDLPGDQQLMTFTQTSTGEVLSSEIVPDDTGLFVIDDPEHGNPVLALTPAGAPDPEEPCDH
jgi:hypothetical protein